MLLDEETFVKAIRNYLNNTGDFSYAYNLIRNFDSFKEEPSRGLDSSFYHTLTFDGDLKKYDEYLQFVKDNL